MKETFVGDQPSRRQRFQYRPDRHYVLAERESKDWDGSGLDMLLDETTANGDDAYRIEADGSKDSDSRRAAGSSRFVLLSCPKEHANAKAREMASRSQANATAIAPPKDGVEEMFEERGVISFKDLPDKDAVARKRTQA
jgi:hypothetical protein